MVGVGHFQRLWSLIAGLVALDVPVHVFTHASCRTLVEQAGGRFVDLFAGHSLESADATSLPIPARSVSFAGRYAEEIRQEVAALDPGLIVHDTFAVIGRVVAGLLRIPRVNVCAGHNAAPARLLEELASDPRVRISEGCHAAVELLRTRYGIADASPFSYVSGLSPDLNVYCEPPEFLSDEERSVFEPVAFYGSLPGPAYPRPPAGPAPLEPRAEGRLNVYVSFGTVIWGYYASDALRLLNSLSETLGRHREVRALISLGGAAVAPAEHAALRRERVAVLDYVDQWRVLQAADLYVTHHGLNSTHEAIFHGVPMLSCPFFWDQPGLARRSQELGVALPLLDAPRGALTPETIDSALGVFRERRAALAESVSRARSWEAAVMARRPAVLERILALSP
jgi:UDP:flavonoid glycosyltransferase YjiC (YdhE family)